MCCNHMRHGLKTAHHTVSVQVDHLSIQREGQAYPAPQQVSLELHPGEVTLLLGPSGAGKSTLALALDGLIPHEIPAEVTGSVRVDGLDAGTTRVAELARHVAMVFQDADAQIVTATVYEEVCFGAENLCLDRETIAQRAEHALRRVGLWSRRRDDPVTLSGGGRARLAIACALVLGSPTIVLDEPTANLDPVGRADVFALLGELADEGRHSILLIEHNLDAAAAIVDRVVVLDHAGSVALDGTVDEVLRGQAAQLEALGVWLPVSAQAGRLLGFDPLPLTPTELAASIGDAIDSGRLPRREASGTVGEVAALGKPAIHAQHLNVHAGRDRTPLLTDVSLAVPPASLTAIVGHNGAGKTTLAQRLAGVVDPGRGAVEVFGRDVSRMPARELAATVGFVFQNPEHQFITESVAAELAHGLRLQGLADDEVRQRVDAMLDRLQLRELRDVHPYLLSGGQKRRLSVGTALVTGARVLVLDEPMYGQDQARAAELVRLLEQLVAEGTTVVIVTHDMQLVAESATHVAVVDDGRLTAFGRAAQVLASPQFAAAGLLPPPLGQATALLDADTGWRGITRLADLRQLLADPGAPSEPAGAVAAAQGEPRIHHDEADEALTTASQRDPRVASAFDPMQQVPPRGLLARLNPVAKLLAAAPLMFGALALGSVPALVGLAAWAWLVLAAGSGAGWRRLAGILTTTAVAVTVFAVSVGAWIAPERVSDHTVLWQIGGWAFERGQWMFGLVVTLKVAVIAMASLVPGLTTTGSDTVRGLVRWAHLPYRFGYTALAAMRFVPRIGHSLEQIRKAHRVRGISAGRGPVAALRRGVGYALPLLADGIRHAERVALSMDARAFGAEPSRTERYDLPWRWCDWAFVLGFWGVAVALLLVLH